MSYVSEILADNPIAYWRLGETVGPIAFDSAGINDALYVDTPTLNRPSLIATHSDGSVLLNSTTEYVDCGNDASVQVNTGTIEAWLKTTENLPFRGVFVKQFAFSLFVNSGTLIAFDFTPGQIRSSGVAVNDGAPHHVALAFGGGTGQLYVDGVPAGAGFVYNVLNHTQNVFLGYGNAGGQFFGGTLDECALYGTKLNAARIAAHYAEAFAQPRRVEKRGVYSPILDRRGVHRPIIVKRGVADP